ncbi:MULTISPECIES: HNH endonuclease [unclassified Sedimentibacter]|uniref:HNH endonuclease n=1 Tax=unclassified Sedimentibacter TaxID=2649220 RepID=UPI0027E17969|nr:HNH endonuclease [Sedimentibacter sp. MB35-C1]WMJ77797.1 HNH endonuclease [Sedimentibacter sp. MB35-C1]
MNNLVQAVMNFKNKELKSYEKKYKICEKERLKFIQLFPKNQIINMELDDYVVGKGKESFCYWLETKLSELGSIKGGSTADKKFGLYYNKVEQAYKTIQKWDETLNVEGAFDNIKVSINELLKAGEIVDVESISKNSLSPMFKSKILATYYPEKYLNVFAPEHVDYFIHKLNLPTSENSTEDKRQLLIEFKNEHKLFKDFNNYIFMTFLYNWSNPKFKEIRILPMSAKYEFPNMTYQEIQKKFFLNELANKKHGEYLFRTSGMAASKGTLVLFQIDNQIIASANLIQVKKFKEPIQGIYMGAYYFNVNTIKVFEPISAKELSEIDENFTAFSQSKQKIDSSKQDLVISLINSKEQVRIPEEVIESESGKYVEGCKKQIVVNAYERNSKAREECIKIHGIKCKICGLDFGEFYGQAFEGKIHVHHIKPLNEIDDEYEVDPEKDLIPVCPNCHMILHSKVGGTYTVKEVKQFIMHGI